MHVWVRKLNLRRQQRRASRLSLTFPQVTLIYRHIELVPQVEDRFDNSERETLTANITRPPYVRISDIQFFFLASLFLSI